MGELGEYWRAAREYRKYGRELTDRERYHVPKGPKTHKCPVCGRKLRGEDAVENHIRSKAQKGDVPHRDYIRARKKAATEQG